MFKSENFYTYKKGLNFAEAIQKIHEKVMQEFELQEAKYGYRDWDRTYHVTKNKDENYTCDNHVELLDVLSNIPYFESFIWHNIYEPKPSEKHTKVSGLFSSKTIKIKQDSVARFGVGIDYSRYEIVIAVHSENLSFIERIHSIIKDELSLERPQRLEKDGYRRKMLEPNIFVARHFDNKGDEYYSILNNFLSLLGFNVSQGEEYQSTGIPDKVKHRIDENEIIIINASGNRNHDWLISEASYSLGKNKHLIMLVESITEIETGILGKDFEYIKYPENEIEKIFAQLLREFRSIGIKGIFY